MKKNLLDLSYESLGRELIEMGLPSFKTGQIWEWLYRKNTFDFNGMTDLSKEHREVLAEKYAVHLPKIVGKQKSIDGTEKFLMEMEDKKLVECVLMEYSYGHSLCISSQVGCRMGCVFCASGQSGYERNLTPGEMTGQILSVGRETGKHVSRIVIMGMGEPFDNYENVVSFIGIAMSPKGLNIGGRKITVSTCGIVPGIRAFTGLGMQVNLSVSLHQADNRKRDAMMPINRKYPLDMLMEACREYVEKTNRRISFEYALIPGLNDDAQSARALCVLLSGILCYINIIPVNNTGTSITRSAGNQAKISEFCGILKKQGFHTTVRRELGNDIDAACGQLKRRHTL
ncbi:MAG: 23S rRNA (adenine(2503)-C(2))-methyltransferase RlmN [Clostridia bacterium]